jgi:hypothetical protein
VLSAFVEKVAEGLQRFLEPINFHIERITLSIREIYSLIW